LGLTKSDLTIVLFIDLFAYLFTHFAIKMPHIEEGMKLDFKDVLLRPKRSTLKSRSEVSINLNFII